MKNFLLFALLAVSLGTNAWLLTNRAPSTFAGADSSASGTSTASARRTGTSQQGNATASAAATAARAPFVWQEPGHSTAAMREFAGQLRAAGFPNDVIVRFVGEMLRERHFAAVAERPFWELMSPGKDTRKLMSQAARDLLREQEEILGAAGSPVATLDPVSRAARFGSLDDAKVATLLRIERDYEEMRSDLYGGGYTTMTSEDVKARQEQQRTIEKERLADITAALSPAEFADWERRQSGNAQTVMYALRDLNVSEEEYTALLAAQKARLPNGSPFGLISLDDNARNPSGTYAFIDSVRATLGDERANTYLKNGDYSYAMAANFIAKNPEIPAAKAFDLYKIQTDAQALVATNRSGPDGSPPSQATREQMQKGLADLNTRLETLLGPTAAEAYRNQGMGGMLNMFLSRPAPKAAPTKP